MSDTVTVTLTAPAKVGGKWRRPGEEVTVEASLVGQLSIEGGALSVGKTFTAAEVHARFAELCGELEDAADRAAEAEVARDQLQARVTELEAALAATVTPDKQTPEGADPVEQDTEAAQTPSKKAGGGTTKG